MRKALLLAKQAEKAGEVPVGALIVKDNEVIAMGYNQPISLADPTAHAEILALRQAGQFLKNYRLPNTTLYVTLEPCAMCLGAMIHARIERLVYGALDPKSGACGGAFDLFRLHQFNHRIDIAFGIEQHSCGEILKTFFQRKR